MKLDLGDLPIDIAADQQPTVEHPQRLRRTRTQLLLSARGRTVGTQARATYTRASALGADHTGGSPGDCPDGAAPA